MLMYYLSYTGLLCRIYLKGISGKQWTHWTGPISLQCLWTFGGNWKTQSTPPKHGDCHKPKRRGPTKLRGVRPTCWQLNHHILLKLFNVSSQVNKKASQIHLHKCSYNWNDFHMCNHRSVAQDIAIRSA